MADKKATVLHEQNYDSTLRNVVFTEQERSDIRPAIGKFATSISNLERSVGEKLDNLAKLSQDLIQLVADGH